LAGAGIPGRLRLKRSLAPLVETAPLDCGHFVAEEAPNETFAALAGFLGGRG